MDIKQRLIKYLESKSLNRNISSNTIKNYLSTLNTILKYNNINIFKNGYPNNYDWLIDNYENIINAIEDGTINQKLQPLNFQTKKQYYILLINLIKSSNDPDLQEILFLFENQFFNTRQNIINFNNSNELTQRQIKNLVSLDAIKKALEIWKQSITTINSRHDYLNLAYLNAFNFLLEMPIKSELINTKIIYQGEEINPDHNYIILNPNNTAKIIISKKTSRIGPDGPITEQNSFMIPQHLIKDLKQLKKYADIYSNKFFITNLNGTQTSQPSFSNYLAKYAKEYFPDKRISINLIKTLSIN